MGGPGTEETPGSSRKSPKRLAAEMTAIFENLSEAVIVVDALGDVLFINRAGREIAGLSSSTWSVHDADSNCLLYPDGQPVAQEDRPALRLLAGKSVKNLELMVVRTDGTQRRVTCNGALFAINGKVMAAVAFRDVTEVYRMEELRQDLIRTMSHDLRNPLAVISAQAQILKRSLEAKGLSHEAMGADVITKASLRMSRLIEGLVNSTRADLLNGSRSDADEKVLVDLDSVARALAEKLNMVQPEARISVRSPMETPKVFGEPFRFEQILENLLSNALKYSPAHSPVLVTFTHDDSWVTVTVKDEGVGIAPEELPKLFSRFYRASSGAGTEGIGLGLYIAKSAVEGLGGRIWVESVLGQGSTFYFSLPVRTDNTLH